MDQIIGINRRDVRSHRQVRPIASMSGPSFGFSEFVEAWRNRRAFVGAHPDLAGFHENRYRAYRLGFGVDLNVPPAHDPPVPDWMNESLRHDTGPELDSSWAQQVHHFVLQVEDQADALESPWSGYFESPPALVIVRDRYRSTVVRVLEDARSELRSMSYDLLVALFPESASRRITSDELVEHGFDPREPAPDPIDYW